MYLVISRAKKKRQWKTATNKQQMQYADIRILGAVLNKAPVHEKRYGYGHYGYGYGYEPKDKKNSSDSAAADKNSTGK